MTSLGRETEKLLNRLVLATEKNAEALTTLADMAKMDITEQEPEPPTCPRCGKVNFSVVTNDEAGSGPLSEYVIAGACLDCGHTIYAIPVGYVVVESAEAVRQIMKGER